MAASGTVVRSRCNLSVALRQPARRTNGTTRPALNTVYDVNESNDHPSASDICLTDRFGRVHNSLRLSVTDRCNIRCFYCMPETGVKFMPREQLLTFEELQRLAELLVRRCGIRDIRITGGEPLVRRGLVTLIEMLAKIDGLEDLSLTTNGILLAEHVDELKSAGLRRLNISLDTLNAATFQKISKRDGLQKVLAGIDASVSAGFESVKINTLAIRGTTEPEIVDLVRFAAGHSVPIRFIEFMPLDGDQAWKRDDVLGGDEILRIIESGLGKLMPAARANSAQPAEAFVSPEGAEVGIIRSVSKPFCGACNRIRLTADGAIRNCLFAGEETPIRDLIRGGGTDDDLIRAFQESVGKKHAAHGIEGDGFRPPDRPMYAIGG